jgi:hypothetical protein
VIGDEQARPVEATVLDDLTTADLTAKVAQAWREFATALAAALTALPSGVDIDLTINREATDGDDEVYEVSVASGDGGLAAHAVSNTMLPPQYRLGREALAHLVALGWTAPGSVPDDDRYRITVPVEQAPRLAAVLERTLKDVYGAPHPAFLEYTVEGDSDGQVPDSLGAARRRAERPGGDEDPHLPTSGDLSALSLPEKVFTVLAALLRTTPDKLPVDADGDVGIRSGSAMVFVRVREDPPLVDVFSPVLTDVTATLALYVKLSELTTRLSVGRLYFASNAVWASVPVFGRDFQATHLMLAVQVMTGLADELDDRLHNEFGGKRFFVEADHQERDSSQPADPGDDGHTGMYV